MLAEELDRRKNRILFSLLEADGWLTSSQLAQRLEVSDRTVRADIAELAGALQGEDVSLLAERGRGYAIPDSHKPRVRAILAGGQGGFFGRNDLLMELLQSPLPQDADELSDRLFVSRTTLENELKQVKKELGEAGGDLVLVRRKNMLSIEGGEKSKRNLIETHIANSVHAQMSSDLINYAAYFPYDQLMFVMDVIYEALRRHEILVSDAGTIAVTVHAMIAVRRIMEGFTLTTSYLSEQEKADGSGELRAAREIGCILGEHFSIGFNDCECETIACCISFRRFFKAEGMDREAMLERVDKRYLAVIEETLREIRELYFLDLSRDNDLLAGLAFHLQSTVDHSDYRLHYVNPILEDIRCKYPFVFELAIHFRNKVKQELGVDFSESETACLAIHLGASVERLKSLNGPQKLKVALVCHASPSNSQFLMAKIVSIFGHRIHLCGPYSAFDSETILKERPGLILTTTTAAMEWSGEIPVAYIKLIPDAKDTQRLGHMIETAHKKALARYTFTDFLSADFFFPALEAKTPAQVINFMADRLYDAKKVLAGFKESTFQRETFSTTVLQNGIALPHPTGFYAAESIIAVATLKEPIQWNGMPARIIFMMAMRRGDQQFLKDFYELVVNLSDHEEYVAKVAAVREFGQLVHCLANLE